MNMSNRCTACRKKLGLMGQRCKCEQLFCISHLQAEQHGCAYDHRMDARKQLAREQLVGPLSDKMTDRI